MNNCWAKLAFFRNNIQFDEFGKANASSVFINLFIIIDQGRQAEGTRGPNFEFEASSRAIVSLLIKLLKLLSFSFSQSDF